MECRPMRCSDGKFQRIEVFFAKANQVFFLNQVHRYIKKEFILFDSKFCLAGLLNRPTIRPFIRLFELVQPLIRRWF